MIIRLGRRPHLLTNKWDEYGFSETRDESNCCYLHTCLFMLANERRQRWIRSNYQVRETETEGGERKIHVKQDEMRSSELMEACLHVFTQVPTRKQSSRAFSLASCSCNRRLLVVEHNVRLPPFPVPSLELTVASSDTSLSFL